MLRRIDGVDHHACHSASSKQPSNIAGSQQACSAAAQAHNLRRVATREQREISFAWLMRAVSVTA